VPARLVDTRVSSPVTRSFMKMSVLAVLPPAAQLLVLLSNTT
jgi:hypothetical protein